MVMDPWLSAHGAFDSAWFQFPCNHHVADFVHNKRHRRQFALDKGGRCLTNDATINAVCLEGE